MTISQVWPLVALPEAVEFLDGQRRPVKVSDRAKMRGNIPYYGASGVVDYVNRYLFDEDLILLGEDGENILSRVVPLAFKITGKSWVNNHAHVLRPRAGFDIDFLTAYLESLDYSVLNSGTAQPKLNKQSCSRIRVVKPPIEEQRAIATVLRDSDDLIATLERLIAKKQSTKQGMLQQLLTGNTRLRGFTDPWRNTTIGELSDQHRNTLDPRKHHDRVFQHFSLPAFDDDEKPAIDRGSSIDSMKFVVPPHAVLVSKLNPRIPRIWAPDDIGGNAIASTEFVVMTPRPGTNRSFLKWLVKAPAVAARMKLLATGTTGSHARIHPRQVAELPVAVPSGPEQGAIAAILDDAENEVRALNRRLDKARSIKLGMMQELLAGRARLPVEVAS